MLHINIAMHHYNIVVHDSKVNVHNSTFSSTITQLSATQNTIKQMDYNDVAPATIFSLGNSNVLFMLAMFKTATQ